MAHTSERTVSLGQFGERTMSDSRAEVFRVQRKEFEKEVGRALQRQLRDRLVTLVLFGSQARGEAQDDSDWDLLVIAHDLSERPLERYQQMKQILPEPWRGRVSILAKTPEEFESGVSSLWLDIALDGVLLYDSQGYAGRRLGALKRLIEQRGLLRERVGQELVWRWKRFPGYEWSLDWKDAR